MARTAVPHFDGEPRFTVEQVRDILQARLVSVSGDSDVCTDEIDADIYAGQYEMLFEILTAITGPHTRMVMPS